MWLSGSSGETRGVVLPGPGYVEPTLPTAPRAEQQSDFERNVREQAPNADVATLRSLSRFLEELLVLREGQPPPGLKIGAPVHASHVEYEWHTYGVVIELSAETALIRVPGRAVAERVVLREQHIRLLSEDEWAHVEPRLIKRNERIAAQRANLSAETVAAS